MFRLFLAMLVLWCNYLTYLSKDMLSVPRFLQFFDADCLENQLSLFKWMKATVLISSACGIFFGVTDVFGDKMTVFL